MCSLSLLWLRVEVNGATQVFNPVTIGSHQPAPALNLLDESGYVNQHGLSRKVGWFATSCSTLIDGSQHIFDSVQASLKRLQLDYIDVLQCHR